eukprot:TRINITY_DN11692_c0_g1_i4.p1 TRINITY_DN11692_c0_g1~~TRINITY_DN11692_c0_g1_i4.p1  ORF type:complete len:127 (+),score=30.74 TRINITY_DN11692_c0_g1_i4:16-396(+)
MAGMVDRGIDLAFNMQENTSPLPVQLFLIQFPEATNKRFFGGTNPNAYFKGLGGAEGTLLHWACYRNNKKITSYLLSRKDIDLTVPFNVWGYEYGFNGFNGLTAQEIADKRDHQEITSLFQRQTSL